MRNTIRGWVLGGLLLTATAAHADVPVWFQLGGNVSRVDKADVNCTGGQTGLGFGKRLMVKGQYTALSFEAEDDGGDCDLGLWGDTAVEETALLVGLAARSGVYVAAGPAAVHVRRDPYGPWGDDTGTRFEVGYQSRLDSRAVSGIEVALFATDNEVRKFGGLAISWTIGNRSRGAARPRPRADRY